VSFIRWLKIHATVTAVGMTILRVIRWQTTDSLCPRLESQLPHAGTACTPSLRKASRLIAVRRVVTSRVRLSGGKIPLRITRQHWNSELKILIRDGGWWLGDQLISALADDGHLTIPVPHGIETGHDESTDDLVAGSEALVVFGLTQESGEPGALIDHSTRQLYNLLHAASEAGARRCVYVSSLRLFEDYEENLTVTEKWRSLPPTEDVPLLACHLGEIVCKEFARDRRIQVATIRLGFPVVRGDQAAAQASGESAAVSGDDAVEAIKRALTADTLAQWQDIHVQSQVDHQRYLMHAAGSLLSFPR
jgi:hypothetical protein